MLENFRTSSDMEEISTILDRSHDSETLLWQNAGKGRVLYQIKSFTKHTALQTIEFHLTDYKFDFKSSEAIYVKLSYRDTLFKGHVVSIEHDIITVYFPKEIKTQELRSNPRCDFMVTDRKNVILRLGKTEDFLDEVDLLLKVLNVSEGGICLIVTDKNKVKLQEYDIISMTHMGETELPVPISLKFSHQERYRYRETGKLYTVNRIGFQFMKKIPQELLLSFVKA